MILDGNDFPLKSAGKFDFHIDLDNFRQFYSNWNALQDNWPEEFLLTFPSIFRTLSDWLTNFRSIFLLNSYSFKSGIFHFIFNKFSSSILRQLFTKFSGFWLKILLNFIEKINKKFVKIEFGLNKFLSIINLIKFSPPPTFCLISASFPI